MSATISIEAAEYVCSDYCVCARPLGVEVCLLRLVRLKWSGSGEPNEEKSICCHTSCHLV
jgi:hypothetical protein